MCQKSPQRRGGDMGSPLGGCAVSAVLQWPVTRPAEELCKAASWETCFILSPSLYVYVYVTFWRHRWIHSGGSLHGFLIRALWCGRGKQMQLKPANTWGGGPQAHLLPLCLQCALLRRPTVGFSNLNTDVELDMVGSLSTICFIISLWQRHC